MSIAAPHWLALSPGAAEPMDARRGVLLDAVRDLLDRLRPPRLLPTETWSAAFAHELVMVLPLHQSKHLSFQIAVREDVIMGDWQDRHYAWDVEPKKPQFVVRWDAENAVTQTVEHIETALRRPIVAPNRLMRVLRLGDPRVVSRSGTAGQVPAGYFRRSE